MRTGSAGFEVGREQVVQAREKHSTDVLQQGVDVHRVALVCQQENHIQIIERVFWLVVGDNVARRAAVQADFVQRNVSGHEAVAKCPREIQSPEPLSKSENM
jgi:hypothetical protein